MMEENIDLIEMIKAQITLEKSTANKIKDLEELISNLAAKLLLAEMRFDTEKHAKILQTMLDLMKKLPKAPNKFWETETHEYVDAMVVKEMLEDHVNIEVKMLKHTEGEIGKTDDDALKLLFQHIVDDERKHHKIMDVILKRAFKMTNIP